MVRNSRDNRGSGFGYRSGYRCNSPQDENSVTGENQMSNKTPKHGKSVGRSADIYREIEELAVCMIGAAMLICLLPLLKYLDKE